MSLSGEEQSGQMSLSGEDPSGRLGYPYLPSSGPPPGPPNEVGRPRLSVRSAAVRVLAGLALAGVLVGAIWAWLAPPVHGIVALTKGGDRVRGYLGDESDHLFLGAFVMTGLLVVLAVVSAVLVWQWRAHRGPVLVAALATGALAAAGIGMAVGAALARWRYGAVDVAGAPVTPEHRVHYVIEAPPVLFGHTPLQIAAMVLVPAGVAAFVYALCSLTSTRDDLGAWPPVEPRYFTGPVQTAVDAPLVDPSSPSR